MGRSTVKRWLRWLQEHHYLQIIESHHESGRQQAHNYRLTLGEGSKSDQTQFDPQPDSEPPEGSNCEPPLKEPEEKPEDTPPTPQGGRKGGFDQLWQGWPDTHMPDNRDYAKRQFDKLTDVERDYAVQVLQDFRRRCSMRGQHPHMIPYLKERQFLDLIDPPEMDDDGDFIIRPKRPEWREWMGDVRKKHGEKGVANFVTIGKIVTKTRWPDGFGRLPKAE